MIHTWLEIIIKNNFVHSRCGLLCSALCCEEICNFLIRCIPIIYMTLGTVDFNVNLNVYFVIEF